MVHYVKIDESPCVCNIFGGPRYTKKQIKNLEAINNDTSEPYKT